MDWQLLSLVIFLGGHLIATVWWASRVHTVLGVLENQVETIVTKLDALGQRFVTREEMHREIEVAEQEHKAMWKRIDEVVKRQQQSP